MTSKNAIDRTQKNNEDRSACELAGSCATVVLCGANAYEQKYYLNEDFSLLPQQIKDELQILSVTYTEENGGVFTMEFNTDGALLLKTAASETDPNYDEIGAQLRIKRLMDEKRDLFASLELFYKAFVKREIKC